MKLFPASGGDLPLAEALLIAPVFNGTFGQPEGWHSRGTRLGDKENKSRQVYKKLLLPPPEEVSFSHTGLTALGDF